MKIWLKQLFCKHIWKSLSWDEIGKSTQYLYSIPIREYTRYAVTWECVKCKKDKITEEKQYHDLP